MEARSEPLRQLSPARTIERVRHANLDWPWAISAFGAAILLLLAFFLPLWQMTLLAPQYPGGLELTAYGTSMEGDLSEINGLNHYIGVRTIEPDSVIELQLFPFVLFPAVAGLLVAALLFPPRWLRATIAAAVWAFPVGMLIDLQYWLYTYGHDLDPKAPVKVDPFTPKVVGSTNVMNFNSETMVAAGFWAMLGAALLVTIGPWLIRFVRESWNNTGESTGSALAVFALPLAAAGALMLPGVMQGTDDDTASIGAMIEAAEPGDTIVVPAGRYEEQLVIDKSVVLDGQGQAVIDGGGDGDVVRIEAEDVTFRGFTVQHSGRTVMDEPAGIRVMGDNATVANNTVRDALYGIVLQDSDGHLVDGNHISSIAEFPVERRGHAIYLWHTSENLVTENTVETAKDGVFVGFGTHTEVTRNRVTDVRYGIHYMYSDDNAFRDNVFRDNIAGAALMYSRRLTLDGNEFSYNKSGASGYGLLMKDVDDVVMTGNRVYQNRIGLTLEGAPQSPQAFVTIRDNFIGHNQVGLELFSNTSIAFSGNTFAGNLEQVASKGGNVASGNTWEADGRGNYWDDYQGYDANGDGIGDRRYVSAGVFQDLAAEEPALRAFAYTPAQTALDLAADWFAAYEPEPVVVDDAPLMSPAVALSASGRDWGQALAGFALMLPLVVLPLATFRIARHALARG